MLTHGREGFLTERKQPASIAAGAIRLLSDPALRTQMSEAGKRTARKLRLAGGRRPPHDVLRADPPLERACPACPSVVRAASGHQRSVVFVRAAFMV